MVELGIELLIDHPEKFPGITSLPLCDEKHPGKIIVSFLKPIKPGLNRDDFIKNLETKIYNEIENIS